MIKYRDNIYKALKDLPRILILFILLQLFNTGSTLAQIPANEAGLQIGWEYSKLVDKYGQPTSKSFNKGFVISKYKIDMSIISSAVNEEMNRQFHEIFQDNYLYFALNNNIVYAGVSIFKSKDLKAIVSMYKTAVAKRKTDYGRAADESDEAFALWYVKIPGFENMIIDGVIFDVVPQKKIYICKLSIHDWTYPEAVKAIATSGLTNE